MSSAASGAGDAAWDEKEFISSSQMKKWGAVLWGYEVGPSIRLISLEGEEWDPFGAIRVGIQMGEFHTSHTHTHTE